MLLIIKNQFAVSTNATSKTYAAVQLKVVKIFTLHLLVQVACSIALQQTAWLRLQCSGCNDRDVTEVLKEEINGKN